MYMPPSGDAVDLVYAAGYTPPPGDVVDLVYVKDAGLTKARSVAEHPYALPAFTRSLAEHPYAGKVRATTAHLYRSAETMRQMVTHAYAPRPTSRRAVAHSFGHMALPRMLSGHPYGPLANPRAIAVHAYGRMVLARMLTGHPYALLANPRAVTVHAYGSIVAAARTAAIHPYAVTSLEHARSLVAHLYSHVEVDGIVSTPESAAASVLINGVLIDPLGIDIACGRSEYAMTATLQVADAAEYQLFARGAVITISIFGDDYTVVVNTKSRRRAYGSGWEYTINCLSPAVLLDSPYADTVSGDLTGLASTLAAQLAGLVPISWMTVNWFIPSATWIAADETPLELLRTLAAAAGAILISEPDGSLAIEPFYPVAVPQWSEVQPSAVISEVFDVYEASDEDDHRQGYNRYLVSDQMTSSDTLRIEDEVIGENLHRLRVYQTPWIDDFSLRHTGGDWVFLEALGIEERRETETVEFVAGEGRTNFPIYGVIAMVWRQANLGTVTHSEDGLLAATVAGESLLEITYTTRARLWTARNSVIEQVQFVAEEVMA